MIICSCFISQPFLLIVYWYYLEKIRLSLVSVRLSRSSGHKLWCQCSSDMKPRWLPVKSSILTNLQKKRGLWTSRKKLTFFSSLLGLEGIINYCFWVEIILCSLTIYAKFGGQTDCTCIAWQGWQSTISTGQGGRFENLNGRCKFVGGGVRGLPPLENFEMWRLGNGIFNILNDIFLWKNSTWIRC